MFNSQAQQLDLGRFYAAEGFYRDLEHFDVTNPADIERYTLFRNLILQHAGEFSSVVDVGCGNGGFVNSIERAALRLGWKKENIIPIC